MMSRGDLRPWKKTRSEAAGDHLIFQVRYDYAVAPWSGLEHKVTILECPDWVNVVAVTPEDAVIFIRQYRHGTEEITLEIPGGAVDAKDGSPVEAGARELREETGYTSDDLHYLGCVAPNPAFQNNLCHFVLARNAHQTTGTQFDSGEDIATEAIPFSQVRERILSGEICHALVVAAFYYFDAWRQSDGRGA